MNPNIEKYKNFGFSSNEKWKEYALNIDSTITDKRLEYIKRRWYKGNIDRTFDPDFDRITFEEFQKQQREKEKNSYKNSSFLRRFFYDAENGMKLMFMTSSVFFHTMALFLAYAMTVLALIRQLKSFTISKEFIKKILTNDFFHNLVYLYLFSNYKEYQNLVGFIPIMMHSWVGICDYAYLRQGKIYERMKKQVDITRANKDTILIQKCLYEIALMLLIIILLIFYDCGTFLLLLFYANYLRLKYILNDRHKRAWEKIDKGMQNSLRDKPKFLQSTYGYCKSLGQWLIKFKGK